jgi:molybdenum cofactor cytidylyltransferase
VRRAVRAAVEAGLEPVVAVLGHDAEGVAAELSGLRCSPVVNADHASGMDSSLRAGVGALPATARAAVVTLADMPFVTAAMIAAVVDRYAASGLPLVVSDYGGVRAPPVLYDRALFADLQELHGGGGKQVVERHGADASVVTWPARALADIDSPADYERVRGELDGA